MFQQLVTVLGKIDPAKLNETLGAVATAFDGRGEKFGRTLSDFDAFLAKINPSLPNLAHDIEAAVPAFSAYADAAPDLIATVDNAIRLSNTIVEEQQNLDEFLVSSIGLADIGNEVIGGNRQALSDVLHVLLPTTICSGCTTRRWVAPRRSRTVREGAITQYSHILFNASITLGTERYRYPEDLPKVARPLAAGRTAGNSAYPRCHRSSGRRSWSLTPGPTRSNTAIRACCSTQTGSSNGCSDRSRAAPQQRDDRKPG